MKPYEIYEGNGKYIFSFGKWGFYNRGWTGYSQPVIRDPDDPTIIKFDSEVAARLKAEEVTYKEIIDWKKI